MTATASEDDGAISVCHDRRRLVGSALRLCRQLGLTAQETRDRLGRDYVKVCRIAREREDEDLREVLVRTIELFFEIYDGAGEPVGNRVDEMVDLYAAISSGSDGEDVYLSDGLWLSSDGSLHERGS
jgi:hypothetical protein